MVGKKVLVVLSLLIASALADKKINLDDIERDNLRTEGKPGSDNARPTETSYAGTDRPEIVREEYRMPAQRYQTITDEDSRGYAPQQLPDKYALPSQDYRNQDEKYFENDIGYRQPSQPTQHIQQYANYRQHQQSETEVPEGASDPSNYETPREHSVYQEEVAVGNQYQSVQQKVATEKYLKNSDKDTLYVNIPMDELLSYYPNLGVSDPSISKNSNQRLPHGPTNGIVPQITIPFYVPSLRRETIYGSSKVDHQIQPQTYLTYASTYPQQTEAVLPAKPSNQLIYDQSPSSNHQQQPQVNQAQQYVQQIVYEQPGTGYAPTVSSNYAEVYARARPSIDGRGNSPGHSYSSQTRTRPEYRYTSIYSLPTRYYELQATDNLVPIIGQQDYQHQSQDGPENYQPVPESPVNAYDLPKLSAGNFKSGKGIQLTPVHSHAVDSQYIHNQLVHSSIPKSLLESYVPSYIIAARDSERYRERPIKLERGFVPSKINFVHSYKKREAE